MKQKRNLLILCAGLWMAFSCSEEFKPTPYTYSNFFTGENSKTWRLRLLEQTADGTVVARTSSSCLADDRFTFYANDERSYETTSGSQECFEGEAALSTSNWSFVSSTATLTMLLPALSASALPFFVLDADDDDMELEIFFDQEATESYRIHFTAIDED